MRYTMSRALALAPPPTPLPNLDLTRSPSLRSPSLDGAGASRQSKIDRARGCSRQEHVANLHEVTHLTRSAKSSQKREIKGSACAAGFSSLNAAGLRLDRPSEIVTLRPPHTAME